MKSDKKIIIDGLIKAYWAELETVMNYIAHATNLDGVRAEEIKKDEKLMAKVEKVLKEKAKASKEAVKSIKDLRKIANEMDEENEDDE